MLKYSKYRIELSLEAKVKFWDYYYNENKPENMYLEVDCIDTLQTYSLLKFLRKFMR